MIDGLAALEVAAPGASDLAGWLLTAVAATVDDLAVRAARILVDRALMPAPDEVETLRASARFYQEAPFADDPRRFFGFLERSCPVPEVTLAPRARVAEGERLAITFPSPYQPANPAYAAEFGTFAENRVVHAELWRHRDGGPRPTVIGLHGFGMGHPTLDAAAIMAPALFAAGLDVALLTLPLHGARAPRRTCFSGQLFANPNVPRINESIAQAIHDLAALRAWLRARDAGPVGVLGLSLGGYVAALAAALMDDLDFAIPVVAPACFGDLAHRFMATSSLYRRCESAALSRQEFRAIYGIHSPLAHGPRLPRGRVLIVAARGDRVVPAEHAVGLWAHWGGPRLAWFTGSHLVPFGRAHVLQEILGFLAECGVLPARV
jgi:pimeloyl-ACP methyl ester carboxylesterase